jgi:predicted nucleotidyltransferase
MFYQAVFRALYKERVRYLVVGGVAVNLYGILRATADLDLFLWLGNVKNVEKFVRVMKKLGYKSRVPVPPEDLLNPLKRAEWQSQKGSLVFTFVHPGSYEQVDIFLKEPLPFKKAYDRRRLVKVADFRIPVISLADLKVMKKLAGREKDVSDLSHLRRVGNLKQWRR